MTWMSVSDFMTACFRSCWDVPSKTTNVNVLLLPTPNQQSLGCVNCGPPMCVQKFCWRSFNYQDVSIWTKVVARTQQTVWTSAGNIGTKLVSSARLKSFHVIYARTSLPQRAVRRGYIFIFLWNKTKRLKRLRWSVHEEYLFIRAHLNH